MAILRTKTTWRRPRGPRATAVADELTPAEQESVRVALKFLRAWIGGWTKLSRAIGIKRETLEQAANRKWRAPTAGFALRASRVAKVRIESLLSGAWPGKADPKKWRNMRGIGWHQGRSALVIASSV